MGHPDPHVKAFPSPPGHSREFVLSPCRIVAKLSPGCHMAAMSAAMMRLLPMRCRFAVAELDRLSRVRAHFAGVPMFYRPEQPDAPRTGILNALVLPRPIGWISTPRCRGSPQPRPLLVLQRRGLPSAAGDVRRDRPARAGRLQGQLRQHRGDAASSWSTSPPGSCARRSTRARSRPRTASTSSTMPGWASARDHGQAMARGRKPRPPRMRPLADRRARIPRPRPAQHGW